MALTLLAADAFTLVLAFELMSFTSWGMVLARHRETASREAALSYLAIALFGAACLIPALALLAPATPSGLDFRFEALRMAAPEGWRAEPCPRACAAGGGVQGRARPAAYLAAARHPAAPSHVSAVMSGAMTKVALYVLIRLLLDLCGPVQPVWWGVPLMAMGAASAVLGALRANTEPDMKAVLACSTIENVGLVAIGIGLALVARASDLPGLAALALGGAMLHALNHGVFKTLLFLTAGAVQHGAGTRALDLLGGLVHSMPITTCCVLAGGVGLAACRPDRALQASGCCFRRYSPRPASAGSRSDTRSRSPPP